MAAMKLRMLLDTLALNYSHVHWPKETVFAPFEEPVTLVAKFRADITAIDANKHLTPEGKQAARTQAGRTVLDAIAKWHAPKLAGLDADLGVHRAALLPPATEKPDDRKLDFLLSHLRDRTPQEIAMFYNSATDDERRVMEAAAASVGRVPMKTEHGLEWQPLLDPETVHDSIMHRASVTNPDGAKKLQELTEIRAMHVTVAGIAAAEVRDVLKGGGSPPA
jgi:hypothetical protein